MMLARWFGRTFLGRRYDEDRLVFRYRDGTRRRVIDPVRVEESFVDSLGREWVQAVRDLSKPVATGLVGVLADEQETRAKSLREAVLAATCKAFHVHPFTDFGGTGTPAGLTEVELFDLLSGYLKFCRLLTEMARPFVSARSRASPSPASPPPASGSGSTSSATRSRENATSPSLTQPFEA